MWVEVTVEASITSHPHPIVGTYQRANILHFEVIDLFQHFADFGLVGRRNGTEDHLLHEFSVADGELLLGCQGGGVHEERLDVVVVDVVK